MTYLYCKSIIERGGYDVEVMKNKLDVFLLADRITQEEFEELTVMITEKEGD